MGKLEPIDNKRTAWEGLWWHPETGYYSSAVLNLGDLRKFKGTVRLYVRKNRYFAKGLNGRPNYVFSLMDAKGENVHDLSISEIDADSERVYTREEIERVMRGACEDGRRGLDPYDLLVEDYIN